MEKEKKKINFEEAPLIIALFLVVMLFVITIVENPKGKKEETEAYLNKINPYANEQITDLTGTTWELKSTITLGLNETFYVNISYENYTFSKIEFNADDFSGEGNYTYGLYFDNYMIVEGRNITPNTNQQVFKITNGNDVTNSSLINWLQSNATLISIDVPEEFYNISYDLQNVLIIGEKPTSISNLEEIEIEIQNFNNYELPQNIMVENASYNWNYETGILTIYDATGNVTITVRAEYISGNYSFIELIDSVVLIPLNTFFNLFNFEIFGVNIYALLTATLTIFVIIKVLLKVFK